MNRRKFLATTTAAGSALASGCVGFTMKLDPSDPDDEAKYKVSLSGQSTHFTEVGYQAVSGLFGENHEIRVQLASEPAKVLDAVLLMVGGEQSNYVTVGLGETSVGFDVLFEDSGEANRTVELLAVKGGEKEWGQWSGGEILERAPLTVEPRK